MTLRKHTMRDILSKLDKILLESAENTDANTQSKRKALQDIENIPAAKAPEIKRAIDAKKVELDRETPQADKSVAEGSDDLELYGLRIGDTVKAVINGKRVQGDVIDIFPETMEVELLLRGGNAGRTVTVDVRDTESMMEDSALDKRRNKLGSDGYIPTADDRLRDQERRRQERERDAERSRAQSDAAAERSRAQSDAAADSMINWERNRQQTDDARTKHEIDVLAHRLKRMQRDDDDWERTFDLMRDRINRYQYSTQRDVDPDQLAAITNIQYQPRRKKSDFVPEDESTASAVDAKGRTQPQWVKLVMKKFPNARIAQERGPWGKTTATLPDGRKFVWAPTIPDGIKAGTRTKDAAENSPYDFIRPGAMVKFGMWNKPQEQQTGRVVKMAGGTVTVDVEGGKTIELHLGNKSLSIRPAGESKQGVAEGSAHGYNVARWYEKNGDQLKLTKWLRKEAGLSKDADIYFDDADLVYGDQTIVPGALVDPKLKFNDLLTAVMQATGGTPKQNVDGVYRSQGTAEGFQIGDEFGISFSEDFEIGSTIVDIVEDGIVIELDDAAIEYLMQEGFSYEDGEILEGKQHGNSNIYDKCWKGHRKVPGKTRGEKGSCKKIKESTDIKWDWKGNDPEQIEIKIDRMSYLLKNTESGIIIHGADIPGTWGSGEAEGSLDFEANLNGDIHWATFDTASNYGSSEADEYVVADHLGYIIDEIRKQYGETWEQIKDEAQGGLSVEKEDLDVSEAEYQGRKVPLGNPMAGDVKKSKVYVKNPQGRVVKVNFGDKKMRIKKSNPNRRKSFRARHNCSNPGPRHKARYWSCRAW
jgi:hypothetical protein